MGTGSLDRPGDKPAPHEESAIARMNAEQQRILDAQARELEEVQFTLDNAIQRKKAYGALGDAVGVASQQAVIDRALDRRLALLPPKKTDA